MKFTVVIEDWLRGDGLVTNCLLDEGKRCCLGFVAAQLGVADSRIEFVANPCEIDKKAAEPLQNILLNDKGFHTPFAADAIDINDDGEIADNKRMAKLRKLAKEHGHEFVFVHRKESAK